MIYLFLLVGAAILLPLMLTLPSVFNRKVTSLLVLAALLLSGAAYALSVNFHWSVGAGAVLILVMLLSFITAGRMADAADANGPAEGSETEADENLYAGAAENIPRHEGRRGGGNISQTEIDRLFGSKSESPHAHDHNKTDNLSDEELSSHGMKSAGRDSDEPAASQSDEEVDYFNLQERKPLNDTDDEPVIRKPFSGDIEEVTGSVQKSDETASTEEHTADNEEERDSRFEKRQRLFRKLEETDEK